MIHMVRFGRGGRDMVYVREPIPYTSTGIAWSNVQRPPAMNLVKLWFITRFGEEHTINGSYYQDWLERFSQGMNFAWARMDMESRHAWDRSVKLYTKLIEAGVIKGE